MKLVDCRGCQGTGSTINTQGWWLKCSLCNGIGKSGYRTLQAVNRRQAYLQSRGDDEQLMIEGFLPIQSRKPPTTEVESSQVVRIHKDRQRPA